MAKAKLKAKTDATPTIPDGMTAKDLTVENRMELFMPSFEKFKKDTSDMFGLALACEIMATPQAIVPRMVLVDLLKKAPDGQNTQNPTTEKTEA